MIQQPSNNARLDRIEALVKRNRQDIDVLIRSQGQLQAGQIRLQNLQVELGQTQAQLG